VERTVALGAGTLTATVAATLVAWWPMTRIGFLGDDLEGVLRADGISSGGSAPLYRPLALASLRLDRALSGLDPVGFHLTNLMLAGIAAWLVGALVWSLWSRSTGPDAPEGAGVDDVRRGRLVASSAAVVLFVVWPSHAEAVAWIGGRGDLLCTIGCLTALLAWLRADSARTAWGRRTLELASTCLLIAALAAKETAAAWPVVVTIIVAALHWSTADPPTGADRAGSRRAAFGTWPLYMAVGAWLIWRGIRLGSPLGGYGGDSFTDGAPTGPIRRLGSVLARSVVPAVPSSAWIAASAVLVVAVTVAVVLAVRNRPTTGFPVWPWAALAACWLVVSLPGAGLGVSATGSIGERLTLLPSVFVVAAVAWAVGELWGPRRRVAIAVAAIVAAIALGGLAATQVRWAQAGEAGDELTRALGTLERDRPTVLLTHLDELGGAYVGRNAVPPVLGLIHGWREPESVWSATTVRGDGPVRTIVTPVPVDGGAAGGDRWRVTVDGPGAAITEVFERPASGDRSSVTVTRVDGRTVDITVGPDTAGGVDKVAVITGDRVRVLTRPGG